MQDTKDNNHAPSQPERPELPPGLHECAVDLLASAHRFWEARNQIEPSAVVWVDDVDGALVVFTRGEYRERLLAAIPEPRVGTIFLGEPAGERPEPWRGGAVKADICVEPKPDPSQPERPELPPDYSVEVSECGAIHVYLVDAYLGEVDTHSDAVRLAWEAFAAEHPEWAAYLDAVDRAQAGGGQ
jgi:hypothetical protein